MPFQPMSPAEARALEAGDRFRLKPLAANPYRGGGKVFVVAKVVIDRGLVEVVDTDGFSFVPVEIERAEGRA